MLLHTFPDLQWLKKQAEERFANRKAWNGEELTQKGWPTVILNVQCGEAYRDNIPGPFSLFSTVKGKSYVNVNEKQTLITEDCFFLSNAHQRYTLEVEKKTPSEVFNIHFGEHWAEEVLKSWSKNNSLLDQPDQQIDSIHFYNKLFVKDSFVKHIQQQLLQTKADGKLKEEELLFQLLTHLLQQQGHLKKQALELSVIKSTTREEISKRLFAATDYLYSFYHKDLSLDELATISCLSKFHFLRLFKQFFQVTPHQFITQLRISKSIELLKSPELEIKTIARLMGFDSAATFSRLFHHQTGLYPSHFRQKHN